MKNNSMKFDIDKINRKTGQNNKNKQKHRILSNYIYVGNSFLLFGELSLLALKKPPVIAKF